MKIVYAHDGKLFVKDVPMFVHVKDGKIYCDSSDPEDWITMNGAHVLLGNNGEIVGGGRRQV